MVMNVYDSSFVCFTLLQPLKAKQTDDGNHFQTGNKIVLIFCNRLSSHLFFSHILQDVWRTRAHHQLNNMMNKLENISRRILHPSSGFFVSFSEMGSLLDNDSGLLVIASLHNLPFFHEIISVGTTKNLSLKISILDNVAHRIIFPLS